MTNIVSGDLVSIIEQEKERIQKENYIQSCRPTRIED
jgi:hypothetical protein